MDLIGAWMCGLSRLSEHTEPHTILSEKYYSPVCVCVCVEMSAFHFLSNVSSTRADTTGHRDSMNLALWSNAVPIFKLRNSETLTTITVLSVLNCHWNVTRVEHAHVTSRSLHLLQTRVFSPVLNKLCVFCVGVCIRYVGVFEERHQEAQVLNIEGENN